jgi:hypothetical protein
LLPKGVNIMSENNDKPKINLAEAIRQKLEQKKQHASGKPGSTFQAGSAKPLKSQNNKKPNNQRRRTGGS